MEKLELETGSTPSGLLERPILSGSAQEIRDAFNVLAARRTVGFSVNPIQLSEIHALISLYGKPSVPIDIFVTLIGMMDEKQRDLLSGNKPPS